MKVKKICFVLTCILHGGAEHQVLDIIKVLKRKGYEISLIGLMQEYDNLWNDFERENVEVFCLNMSKGSFNIFKIFELKRIIKKINPDIIHSFTLPANVLTRLANIGNSKPLITTAQNTYEKPRRDRKLSMNEWLFRLTDGFSNLSTNVSRKGVERYIQTQLAKEKKIMYIPNGININKFQPLVERDSFKKENGLDNCFIWVAVGRLTAQKDYFTLIKAINLLRCYVDVKSFKLLIVGKGALENELINLIEEEGLNDIVKIVGFKNNVYDFLSISDAYVMSSIYEGLPIALLEAGLASLPIVATAVDGNIDVIKEGYNGFLVKPESPKELSLAMYQLMKLSKQESDLMRQNSRERIVSSFDIEGITTIWEEIYNNIINSKKITII